MHLLQACAVSLLPVLFETPKARESIASQQGLLDVTATNGAGAESHKKKKKKKRKQRRLDAEA